MTDVRNEPKFASAKELARDAIVEYAAQGVGDAKALLRRAFGENNLQSHWHWMFPVAVYFAIQNFEVLGDVKNQTDLDNEMNTPHGEAGDTDLWNPIQEEFRDFLDSSQGGNIITEKLGDPREELTSRDVARGKPDGRDGLMSEAWAGGHADGGAGDTVVKRTLKLLAHLLV